MTTDLQPVATADPKRGEAAKAATDLRGHGQGNGMPVWGHDWCADFVEMVWAQEQWDTSGLDDGAANFQEGYLARHPDAMHDKPQVGDAVVYGYMLGLQHRADRVHVSQPWTKPLRGSFALHERLAGMGLRASR